MNRLVAYGTTFVAAAANGSDATGTGSPILDLILPYLNLGLLTVVVIMLVKGVGIVPSWALEREKLSHTSEMRIKDDAHARELATKDDQIARLQADADDLKQTNGELQNLARDRLLPALIESSRLAAAYVSELQRRGQSGIPGPGGGGGP